MAGAPRLGASLLAWVTLAADGAYSAAPSRDRCSTERCLARRQSALGPSLLQVDQRRSLAPGAGDGFEPVDGGADRACRGADPGDNAEGHYTILPFTPDLETCKARCRETHGCRGVEYGGALERCELWTRPSGIRSSTRVPGYTCLRYAASARFDFFPADGAVDRVCRGGATDDNAKEYWRLHFGVATLEACKEKCVATVGCKGVEYKSSGGRCEVWLRPLGIGTTKKKSGYACWRYGPVPTPAPVAPAPTTGPPPPTTKEGCACISAWVMDDYPEDPCLNYCCNPDGAPGGLWCFVHNATCQGKNWGYCDGTPPPARPGAGAPPAKYPGFPSHVLPLEWEHFTLVNRLRAQGFKCPGGRSFKPNPVPLKFDCRLWKAARGHSKDMADRNYFGEEGPGEKDKSPWDRAWDEGISADLLHIAAACDTAQCVFAKWKESDAHCNNLLEPSFNMFAIGVAFNASSLYKYYWTELFKTDKVRADTSCYPPPQLRD